MVEAVLATNKLVVLWDCAEFDLAVSRNDAVRRNLLTASVKAGDAGAVSRRVTCCTVRNNLLVVSSSAQSTAVYFLSFRLLPLAPNSSSLLTKSAIPKKLAK